MLTSRLYLSKTREMPFESQMKMHFGSLTLFMDEKTAVALEFLTCSSVREGLAEPTEATGQFEKQC